MTGSVSIAVRDKRNSYSFVLRRNITLLSGDSGRGKTTLYEMIADYNAYGKASNVKISCDREVVAIGGNNWRERLEKIHGAVIVIDEDNQFVRSKEFADAVKNSDNYFLLITRSYLAQLPYSVDEIYEISGQKNKKFKAIYRGRERMYDGLTAGQLPFKPEVILTEDSGSGYRFFKTLADKYYIECVSAAGKSNIIGLLENYKDKNVLVVADGAAFGAEIQDIVKVQQLRPRKVGIFLPESFEWLILKSGLVNDPEWEMVTMPEKYVDSKKYFSWERYFTDLLVEATGEMEYKRYPANKNSLPEFYIQDKSVEQIRTNMSGIDF